MAERVSEYLADKNISVPYEKIMAYAAEKSGEPESKIMGAHSFIRLAAASLPGNEHDFEARLRTSGRRFVQWGIAVIAEQKNIAFMPLLMELLTDIDPGTAEAAYIALMRITGTDPREKLNRRINDAAVVVFFRDYYLQNRKGN
jgi:hypothetical protein